MSALGQTAAIRQRMLNYLQRLNLIVEFDASRAARFSSFIFPVETFTGPCYLKECVTAHSRAERGRLRHISSCLLYTSDAADE